MTPLGKNGSFHETLMDVDEMASTLTFRGLPGLPTTYIKKIIEHIELTNMEGICETGPTAYSPYPRRLESLTIS